MEGVCVLAGLGVTEQLVAVWTALQSRQTLLVQQSSSPLPVAHNLPLCSLIDTQTPPLCSLSPVPAQYPSCGPP